MNSRALHFRLLCASATIVSLVFSICLSAAPKAVSAQREHLTPEEIERVRDNQELDKRIGVFIKAIERRLQIINGVPAATGKKAAKEAEKDAEAYGAMPTGTRTQLLSDIARILDEAITNIDDASIHAEKSPLIPKALNKLADASERFMPQFMALRERVTEEPERDALESAAEHAQSIIAALKKLPQDAKKK